MFFNSLLVIFVQSNSLNITENSAKTTILNYLLFSTPNIYSFTLPIGRYKFTCYGAQGGFSFNSGSWGAHGGYGAKVIGYIDIVDENQVFYAYVGGMGGSRSEGLADGGFNGGGGGGWCERYRKNTFHKTQKKNGPGGGGGATDIRINSKSLSDRIIVAAGGSGASVWLGGAPGGNLTGFNYFGKSDTTTQISGNPDGCGSAGSKAKYYPSSGGGGGYMGGTPGIPSNNDANYPIANSGSSYISGYPGCTPHPKIQFESGEMEIGVKDGNGLIQIDQLFTCPPNCSSCSGPNQCKTCNLPYRLYDGLCYLSCPSGSIDQYSYCGKCSQFCLTCSELESKCTSCIDRYFLYNDQCIQKCPDGTYEYNGKCYDECTNGTYSKGSVCAECSSECKDCVDFPYKCTDCPKGKYLFNNECLDKCPERTVRNGNKCVTECGNGQFLYKGICYDDCPKGTYESDIICEDCQSPCEECLYDAVTCTKCINDMHLFNSKCYDNCPENYYSYDDLCISYCPRRTFINGNKCVDNCPRGKYAVDRICEECDSSCASCENWSTSCTACKSETFLYENQCVTSCAEGTFIYQNKCVIQCPSGSYPSDNICKEEEDYYFIEEIHERVPLASNGLIAGLLSFVVILFVGLVVYLVLILAFCCC